WVPSRNSSPSASSSSPTAGSATSPAPTSPSASRATRSRRSDAMKPTILTDIEGTAGSISFVREVLFPYARRELPRFVRERGQEPEVRRWLDQVATEHGAMCDDAMVVEVLQGWIDEDRKHTALK